MNAWDWTVMQLMTDTAVLEQDRVKDEIISIMHQLATKLDNINKRLAAG